MEFDDESVNKLVYINAKLCVNSIKLGEMDEAARSLIDLIELLIQRYDEKENATSH